VVEGTQLPSNIFASMNSWAEVDIIGDEVEAWCIVHSYFFGNTNDWIVLRKENYSQMHVVSYI